MQCILAAVVCFSKFIVECESAVVSVRVLTFLIGISTGSQKVFEGFFAISQYMYHAFWASSSAFSPYGSSEAVLWPSSFTVSASSCVIMCSIYSSDDCG